MSPKTKQLLRVTFATAAFALAVTAVANAQEVKPQPEAGKNCLGMVELDIRQSSFSLDPTVHIKNAANATQITVPMFVSDYNKMKEGQKLDSSFRTGSAVFNGSISWRNVTVKKKKGFVCE
ncbi:MAG TPA: hypothetical protein PLW48_10435 [Alphaproteobacteria bacterium]|nr:hypothetical protein [Alphaproteobacteria bacterium]HCS23688.1 hypothetical protein [Rhodospirillaceae bacterium]HRI75899.1 hypothetical protein [Alphaproteobacteria bacterium]HRJ67543.1 hypothetical protein [Alphaproteobacteria bacterium]